MKNYQVKELEINKSFDVSKEVENTNAHASVQIEKNGDYTVKCTFKPRHGKAFNRAKKRALLGAVKVGKKLS